MGSSKPSKFHHYVPQFQLRSLADSNGLIWAYDRTENKYLNISPKAIGGKNKLYTYKDKTGKEKTDVEWVNSQVEKVASPIVHKLHSGQLNITEQERADLAMLIALNWLRTPSAKLRLQLMMEAGVKMHMRVGALDSVTFEKKLKRFKKDTGKDYGSSEELRQWILDDRYRVRFDNSAYLRALLEGSMEMASAIQQMSWQVHVTKGSNSFVIPDINFTTEQVEPAPFPYGDRGLLVPGTQSMCVLTNKVAITMLPEPGGITFFTTDRRFLKSCNTISAVRSQRFLFSNSYELLTSIVKRTKINTFPPEKVGVKVYSGIEDKEFTFTEED